MLLWIRSWRTGISGWHCASHTWKKQRGRRWERAKAKAKCKETKNHAGYMHLTFRPKTMETENTPLENPNRPTVNGIASREAMPKGRVSEETSTP